MLVVVLACFAAGVGLRRTVPRAVGLLPQLDRFVLGVALPALILAKLPHVAVGTTVVVPVAVAWSMLALATIVTLGLARHFAWDRRTTGTVLLVAGLGNTSFLGFAAVEALLGADNLPAALAYDQLGTFLGLAIFGTIVASRYGAAQAGWRPVARRLLTFPPFFALLAVIPLRTWPLPDGVTDVLAEIGRFLPPVAMFALGLRFRLQLGEHVRRSAVWCLATKMVLLPATVLAVAVMAGTTDELAWQTSVLEAGMPPMVTAAVVAAQAGLDGELSAFVVGAGLVVAAVTLPLLRLALG